MRKWIARFSFSLLIIGGFLFYQAYKFQTSAERLPEWQVLLIVVGGALAVALGSQGIRDRHRLLREESERRDNQ